MLSIVDYPGFQDLAGAGHGNLSRKALNAGSTRLSVLAMNERAAELYRTGIYGNTMTSNPRALDVAAAVFGQLTPEFGRTFVDRGKELIEKFEQAADE